MATRGRHIALLIGAVVAVLAIGMAGFALLVRQLGTSAPVAVTMDAEAPGGGAASADALAETKRILLARMKTAGVDDPEVTVDGQKVTLAARDTTVDQLRALTTPGRLHLRRVSASVDDPGTLTATDPLPAPGPRPAAADKLGATAYDLAAAATTRAEAAALPADVKAKFDDLTPAEAASLPLRMQLLVRQVTCGRLDRRPPDTADKPVVACSKDVKYLLDAATVTGADIASAKAAVEPQSGQWIITASFKAGGQERFTDLTKRLTADQGTVAIVLDGVVVSAPVVQGVITGDVQITGQFTAAEAKALAAQLSSGDPLPVTLFQI